MKTFTTHRVYLDESFMRSYADYNLLWCEALIPYVRHGSSIFQIIAWLWASRMSSINLARPIFIIQVCTACGNDPICR
jgi:hypothetical protein